jgi:hypothetical protein
MEAGGRRRKGQRILYFFRTPPAVRVGREAIDEDAMRLLEEYNPDVTFDWGRLLKSASAGGLQSAPGPAAAGSRQERRRDRREPQRPREHARPAAPVDAVEPAGTVEPVEAIDAMAAVETIEEPDSIQTEAERVLEAESIRASEPAGPVEPAAPVEIPERYARLGAAGLSSLRARYADIAVRLAARPLDEAERADLMARAEQLNPDAWTTAGEVSAALEAYEAVFESLRTIIGRRRR